MNEQAAASATDSGLSDAFYDAWFKRRAHLLAGLDETRWRPRCIQALRQNQHKDTRRFVNAECPTTSSQSVPHAGQFGPSSLAARLISTAPWLWNTAQHAPVLHWEFCKIPACLPCPCMAILNEPLLPLPTARPRLQAAPCASRWRTVTTCMSLGAARRSS